MASILFIGLHGTGKSTKMVLLARKIKPRAVYLIAKNPYQKDEATGQLVFPKDFIRTDASILEPEREQDRTGTVIIVDDSSVLRREWRKFEQVLENPRQNAVDFFMSMHAYELCPPQLFGYIGKAFCFRTASDPPLSVRWGLKKQMAAARKYIVERGNIHSYFVVDNTEGTVRVVL